MAPVTRTSETKPTGQTEGGAEAGKIRGPREYTRSGVDISSVKTKSKITNPYEYSDKDPMLKGIPAVLDEHLADGGSPQLAADREAFYQFKLGEAKANAEARAKKEGRELNDKDLKNIQEEVDQAVGYHDFEILLELYEQQQVNEKFGIQNPMQKQVIVDGINVLTDIDLPGGADLPPSMVVGMADDPVALLEEVMGGSVGSSAFQDHMQQLDEEGQKEFARNILLALNATYVAAKNDPEYAKALGIDSSSSTTPGVFELGEMPPEFGLMPGGKAAWIAIQLAVYFGKEQDEQAEMMMKKNGERPAVTDDEGRPTTEAAAWADATQLEMARLTKLGEMVAMFTKFYDSISRSGKEAADAAVG